LTFFSVHSKYNDQKQKSQEKTIFFDSEMNDQFHNHNYSNGINEELNQNSIFKERISFKNALLWICGIEGSVQKVAKNDVIDTSIDEKPTKKNICDLNVVIALAIAGFFYGFFNKFD
jgi:hypothetical protein